MFKIFSFIAAIIIIILVMSYIRNKFSIPKDFTSVSDREIVSIVVVDPEKKTKDKELSVEIVNSAESTTQGLSGRDEIGNDGMLFLFPEKSIRNFWMKEMKLDLDIIWINGDKIVGISKDVKKPEPNTKNSDLELVSINRNIDKVLELNAGDAEKFKIEVGNVVILK